MATKSRGSRGTVGENRAPIEEEARARDRARRSGGDAGADDNAAADFDGAPIEATEAPTQVSVEKAGKPKKRPPTAAKKAEQQAAAGQIAGQTVVMLNTGALVLAGPSALMTAGEQTAIMEPLTRIIERFEPEVSAAVLSYSDPVVLLLALGMWGARVASVRAASQATAEAIGRGPRNQQPHPPTQQQQQTEQVSNGIPVAHPGFDIGGDI